MLSYRNSGLLKQERITKQYCDVNNIKFNGLKILKELGSPNTLNRDKFLKMMELVTTNHLDTIYVYAKRKLSLHNIDELVLFINSFGTKVVVTHDTSQLFRRMMIRKISRFHQKIITESSNNSLRK